MHERWSLEKLPMQQGKVAVITGANTGLGFEVASALAGKGALVVLACRDPAKGAEAQAAIRRLHRNAHVECMQLDLSSLRSVRGFAEDFNRRHPRLDLLVNNAGVMFAPFGKTEDGFETHFATNYLGHFALTGLLLPALTAAAGSRVVAVSSLSYKWSAIRFDDLNAENGYSRRTAYGQSKRACLVFAYELQRRLSAAGQKTVSVAAHPGLSKTNLDRYFPALIRPLGNLFLQPAKRGALPLLYAALDPAIKGGEFIGPHGFRQMRGYPTVVDSDAESKKEAIGGRLWEMSEALTGVKYL